MDELFQKCLFEGDEKETVLRAIRIVQPDYQLPPAPKPQTCKSALLDNFYSKVSRRVGVEVLEVATRRSHVLRVRSGPAQDCGMGRTLQPALCSPASTVHQAANCSEGVKALPAASQRNRDTGGWWGACRTCMCQKGFLAGQRLATGRSSTAPGEASEPRLPGACQPETPDLRSQPPASGSTGTSCPPLAPGAYCLALVAGEGGVLPQAGFLCAGAAGALPAAAGDGAEQHHHHPVGGVDQTADPTGPQSGKLGVPGAACRELGAVQSLGLARPRGVL